MGLFFAAVWPFGVVALWVLVFEGATFFLNDRKWSLISRSVSLCGATLWMIYGFYRLSQWMSYTGEPRA